MLAKEWPIQEQAVNPALSLKSRVGYGGRGGDGIGEESGAVKASMHVCSSGEKRMQSVRVSISVHGERWLHDRLDGFRRLRSGGDSGESCSCDASQ